MAYELLCDLVPLLLCPHFLLFSILLICSSHTNFFLYLEHTRQADTLRPLHLLLSSQRTFSQIFTWLTPLLASGLLLKYHLTRLSLAHLKLPILHPPSLIYFLIVFPSGTDTLYILVIHFVSFSSSEYKTHEGRDFCLWSLLYATPTTMPGTNMLTG